MIKYLFFAITFVEFSYSCLPQAELDDKTLQHIYEDTFLANKTVLQADSNCDQTKLNTFFCYNNGECNSKFVFINKTHIKKVYFCVCDSVNYFYKKVEKKNSKFFDF